MAANKPGKATILAAFFDDGAYSPLFTDGAVSAAYGSANGQSVYVVFEDGTPVMGLPGCVMYAKATVFDLILPRVAANVPVTKADLSALGHGGLCLGCKPCHYPNCAFGKGV